MNRAVFITAGIVLIIAVVGLWLYLFLNDSSVNTTELFSDLGIVESTERTVDPVSQNGERGTALNLSDGLLQPVTTDAVAGFGVASTSLNTNLLRYVERGTGHIYEVNLGTGLKNQISPTTIPNTTQAYFSSDLQRVALVTEGEERLVTVLTLPRQTGGTIEQLALPGEAENLEFLDDDTVAYTLSSFTQTVGYDFDLDEQVVTERFRLTLPNATVVSTDNQIFAYPKPTAALGGAVYQIINNTLEPLSEFGLGMVPLINDTIQIVNQIDTNQQYVTEWATGGIEQAIVMLPEKCAVKPSTASTSAVAYCGAPVGMPGGDYLEDWYKGLSSSDDLLWRVDIFTGEVTSLATPLDQIGRQLDVTHLRVGPQTERVFFINKIDASLWVLSL